MFYGSCEARNPILAFSLVCESAKAWDPLRWRNDPAAAKAVLGGLRMIFEETAVAVVRLAHRPGELGRAAVRLGEGQINIDYSYCGLEPGSTRAQCFRGGQRDKGGDVAGRTGNTRRVREFINSHDKIYWLNAPNARAYAGKSFLRMRS